MSGPAYRLETERLVVRCWSPQDAALLQEAIDASVEHLRTWMPWARQEPQSVEQKAELLRTFRGNFDLGHDRVFGILDRDERQVLGGTGLHPRVGPRGVEIGFWVHVDHTGRGIATESTLALTRVAFELDGVDRVEIHCDPANAKSAAVAERAGYAHEATLRRRGELPDEPRDTMIWTLFRHAYPGTPAASLPLRAWDAAGRELLQAS